MHYFRVPILACLLTVSAAVSVLPTALADDNLLNRNIVMHQLTSLRDGFSQKTKLSGIACGIAPPNIVLTDKASFGSYEPETNTLQTPMWQQLTADEKAVFVRLAGPGAATKAVRERFERGVHRWVFIHEMGHWWQKCTHANQGRLPYQVEYDANRIAAAYWRESDPKFMTGMFMGFQKILEDSSNPVPVGIAPERYFNENYEELTLSPRYTWFQAQMITAVGSEKPVQTFVETLNEPAMH